ncbi:MAG: hypothetical protein Q4E69_01185 [Bacilli bacterium]|nr:hypothetical protein [Bacilli bacterium]
MDFRRYKIKGNYLAGIKDLVGRDIVNDRMKGIVLQTDLTEVLGESNISAPKGYYALTKALIDNMGTRRALSDNVSRALAEAIAVHIWSDFSGDGYYYDKSIMPENHIQKIVGEVFMSNVGSRETAILALRDPDFLGRFLSTIPYNGESFLSFFTRELDAAAQEQEVKGGVVKNIGDFDHALNCTCAIVDCSSRLGLPKERMDKVVERVKQKRRANERERG